jgi:hypothetical protein
VIELTRKTKAEMMMLECPSCASGHRCVQKCKADLCIHYVDMTKPSDTEDYGACLLWTDMKGN